MKFMQQMIMQWWKKERKIILASVAIGFIFTLVFMFVTESYAENVQSGIANEVIRFHVLANSDSPEDQALKIKVRDGILDKFKDELNSSESLEETKAILLSKIDKIEACAKEIITSNGYDYSVTASIEDSNFPTKTYGEASFPAGKYEALRIVIGNGEGANWWCIMFPPLCFVDITHSEMDEQAMEDLKNILTNEEYDLVVKAKAEDLLPVKIKFKIVEWWQERKYPVETYAQGIK